MFQSSLCSNWSAIRQVIFAIKSAQATELQS